jgi:hypothetical protein
LLGLNLGVVVGLVVGWLLGWVGPVFDWAVLVLFSDQIILASKQSVGRGQDFDILVFILGIGFSLTWWASTCLSG